jgi:hypothetical protein
MVDLLSIQISSCHPNNISKWLKNSGGNFGFNEGSSFW